VRAWLVTWEWASDSAAVFDRVAAILNPRLSATKVAEYVEFLYALATSNAEQLAENAKNRKNNPDRAQIEISGQIICGHHPWLRAQGVKDLKVIRDSATGLETLTWHTLPVYRLGPAGRETVSSGRTQTSARRIVGPLSHELAWDRMAGKFKPGYTPDTV
jgi:hypothetical protein